MATVDPSIMNNLLFAQAI